MTHEELSALLDILRSKGVAKFQGLGVTVLFGSPDGQAPAELTKPETVAKAFKELMAPSNKPRGADGLTAEEQSDLYGQVLDEMNPEEG